MLWELQQSCTSAAAVLGSEPRYSIHMLYSGTKVTTRVQIPTQKAVGAATELQQRSTERLCWRAATELQQWELQQRCNSLARLEEAGGGVCAVDCFS